jgi:L-cysteine/cystine lyase
MATGLAAGALSKPGSVICSPQIPLGMSGISEIRRQLHLPDRVVAINAGSWGPLCEVARAAVARGLVEEAASRGDAPESMAKASGLGRYATVVESAKQTLGRFLGCSPAELALCDSTTAAMNIFLWGYDWKPGDELLTGTLENPAATIPMRMLAERRGVKIVWVDQGNGEEDSTGSFCRAVRDTTRMVLVSDVNFANGRRVDLAAVSKAAHERRALVLADGIQAVGTCQVDVRRLGVDAYALSRHKFLCGPDGGGALYVSREAMPLIKPTVSGVFSSADHGAGTEVKLPDSAERYEVSTRSLPVIEGAAAATEWIMDRVGLPFIFKHTGDLYRSLWDRLAETPGVKLLSPRNQSSLLSFNIAGKEPGFVVGKLKEEYIFSRVIDAMHPPCLRLSLGFWNRDSDIETIAEAVRRIAKSS